jgi:predicted AlkP superfamily phosphohydrolase/phosphomutase
MPKRTIVIGLDCISPKLTKKFIGEGILPNMKRLMDNGVFAKALPCFPAWTPTNWTTIATGAYPGTHSVFMWGTHKTGDSFDKEERSWAMSSSICTAEYAWEAAARVGKKTVLFGFVGYPQTTEKAIHVDWLLSPGGYFFEICKSETYSNFGLGIEIELRPAVGWKNLRENSAGLESEIQVPSKETGTGPTYHLLVTGGGGEFDKIVLSREKDAESGEALRPGDWSGWMIEDFTLEQGIVQGSVRFKLLDLTGDAKRLRLYRSQVYPLTGFTVPKDLGGTLCEKFGPYLNEDVGHAYTKGLVDWSTLEEELGYHIEWIGKASKYLMETTESSLYFIHWHLLDSLKHHCLGLLDPVGTEYDPSRADEAWDEMRKGYMLADRLVGKLASMADDDTTIVVVSDHGNSPNRKRVSLVNLFLEKGWMQTIDGPDGEPKIDPRSKVRLNSLHLYINLQGRDPNGVVPPEDYESFRDEIVETLRMLRDPTDGEPALSMVLRKENAGCMGMWGDGIGDVVFCYSPGHGWTGGEVVKMGEKRIVFPSGGANHGPQPPWTETEVSSVYATLIMSGPGVKKNKVVGDLSPLVRLVDVCPTVCHLTDLPVPLQSEGRILQELLVGGSAAVERPPRPDVIMPEFPVSKGPPKFKGDVTDEL